MPSSLSLRKSIFEKISRGSREVFQSIEKRSHFLNKLSYVLAIAAIISGVATYIALSKSPPFKNNLDTVYWLLNVDIILMLALTALVGRRVVLLWMDRRQQQAGSSLHVKLVAIFSVLAALPAILMMLFSIFFFELGVQTWFGERIATAVQESQSVAQAYLKEHQQTIRADALAMANDLDRAYLRLVDAPDLFQEFMRTQSQLRNLPVAYIINSSAEVISSGGFSLSFTLPREITESDINRAQEGDVILLVSKEDDRVQALVKLNNYFDRFLLVGRPIEDGVLNHIELTNKAVKSYTALEGRQSDIKITVTLIFALIAMLLVITSVWVGFAVAEYLIRPISNLIDAAERVRSGDLNARVADEEREDELGLLARAFNKMTDQLYHQRKDLIDANQQIDERRRFTEAVLTGVSAGVLSLDPNGTIILSNKPAIQLLKQDDEGQLKGRKISDINPDMEKIRRAVRRNPGKTVQTEIKVSAPDEEEHVWVVRISAQQRDNKILSYTVTFDDISQLVKAQKQAAWADVARRIAHEIKNPLTPIQLAAERLKKKYEKLGQDEQEEAESYTETIMRHVENIGAMVDEFSAFARMPEAKKSVSDLVVVCKQALTLFDQANSNIDYVIERDSETVEFTFDPKQLMQAFTNLVKNATESVQSNIEKGNINHGKITIKFIQESDFGLTVDIVDNGLGFPDDISLDKLVDPYVTTREHGTGLGLAIVSKILEDHGASMSLHNNEKGNGATIRLYFPQKIKTSRNN